MLLFQVKLTAPTNGSSADLGSHRPMYLWTEQEVNEYGCEETTSLLLHVEEWALRHYMHNEGFEKGRPFITGRSPK